MDASDFEGHLVFVLLHDAVGVGVLAVTPQNDKVGFPVFERVVDLFVFDCDFKLEGADSLLASLRGLAIGFLKIFRHLKFRNLVLEGLFAPFLELFLVRLRQAGLRDRKLPVAALDDGGVFRHGENVSLHGAPVGGGERLGLSWCDTEDQADEDEKN